MQRSCLVHLWRASYCTWQVAPAPKSCSAFSSAQCNSLLLPRSFSFLLKIFLFFSQFFCGGAMNKQQHFLDQNCRKVLNSAFACHYLKEPCWLKNLIKDFARKMGISCVFSPNTECLHEEKSQGCNVTKLSVAWILGRERHTQVWVYNTLSCCVGTKA